MSFLKNLFGGQKKKNSFDKSFEKSIMKSCLANNSLAKIQANELSQIRSYLEGKCGLRTEEALKQFFQIIESGTFSIPSRLKILTTFHKYIIELGELFALEFLQYKFLNLLDHVPKKPKQILIHAVDVDDWINENVLTYYFNYLLRLANNYQIYKICIEEGQLPQTEDAKLDYKLKFMWLFKLNNIFSYILKMHISFSRVFKDYPSYFLIQDIALLVLHDCVSYYNVMSKEIGDLVQTYPLLTTIDSIQFYQVYTELNNLTEQMNSFFFMKQRFDQFDYIIEPKWFYVTAKVHKEIEMYSRKVELLHTSAANMRRTLKGGDNNAQARQGVNFTETAQYDKIRSKSALLQSKQPTQKLPTIKLQQVHSQNIQNEDTEEESHRNQQNGMKQAQHNRMKTENVFSAAKQEKEEYIQQLHDDELRAIKQYEQLLKQQKSMSIEGDEYENKDKIEDIDQNQQQNNDQKEKHDDDEQDEQQINIQIEGQNQKNIINQMQKVINQQSNQPIFFTHGKPYTFRQQDPQEENENEEESENNNKNKNQYEKNESVQQSNKIQNENKQQQQTDIDDNNNQIQVNNQIEEDIKQQENQLILQNEDDDEEEQKQSTIQQENNVQEKEEENQQKKEHKANGEHINEQNEQQTNTKETNKQSEQSQEDQNNQQEDNLNVSFS